MELIYILQLAGRQSPRYDIQKGLW